MGRSTPLDVKPLDLAKWVPKFGLHRWKWFVCLYCFFDSNLNFWLSSFWFVCLSGVGWFVALLFCFFLVLFWFGMVRHAVDSGVRFEDVKHM